MVAKTAADMFSRHLKHHLGRDMFCHVENINGLFILLKNKGSTNDIIFAIISMQVTVKSFLILLRHGTGVS